MSKSSEKITCDETNECDMTEFIAYLQTRVITEDVQEVCDHNPGEKKKLTWLWILLGVLGGILLIGGVIIVVKC
jgi:hypothetical protein